MRRRAVLPVALSLLGAWLLVGCFYVPGSETPIAGPNPNKLIGKAKSDKPLRPGFVDRSRVREQLGHPDRISTDGRAEAYVFKMRSGSVVAPLCFSSHPASRYIVVRLDYDEGGVLRRFEFERGEPSAYGLMGQLYTPTPTRLLDSIAPATRPTKQSTSRPSGSSH
jgi:hypothetical protein